jgi:hypothetical protein
VRSAICDFTWAAVFCHGGDAHVADPARRCGRHLGGGIGLARELNQCGSAALPRMTVTVTFEPGAPRSARMPSTPNIVDGESLIMRM